MILVSRNDLYVDSDINKEDKSPSEGDWFNDEFESDNTIVKTKTVALMKKKALIKKMPKTRHKKRKRLQTVKL